MNNFETKIKHLCDNGITVIPDYPDDYYKEDRRRTPCIKWSGIEKPLEYLELVDLIKEKKSNLVEAICGEPSGGLVCWDVDTKNYSGFDAVILNDFRELYGSMFNKMKIERTPSGGLHIYYRIEKGSWGKEFPSGGNIASRYTTDDERIIKPTKKTVCFLEFKGAGLLSRCYPSIGYSEVCGSWGGVLTWEEHCSIYSHCKFYDKLVKDEYIKPPQSYTERYVDGDNPFQSFDKSNEGSQVLINEGWEYYDGISHRGRFHWYKKKWKKAKEVGATYNTETRLYKIYTTQEDLDVKSYSPSNLLAKLKNWNKKQLYEWLVSRGFGTLKKQIEYNIIKARVLDGKDLPKNISKKGLEIFEQEKEKKQQQYPHGTFWKEITNEGGEIGFKISREDIYKVSKELGFRKHKEKICYIEGYIVKNVVKEFYYNKLKEYIVNGGFNLELINTYEAFLQASGEFTISRLEDLDMSLVLRSTKSESLKFYKNCYIRITSEDVEVCSYDDVVNLIWDTDIKQRDFVRIDDMSILKYSTYYTFLKNAIGNVDSYLLKCMGFYAHDHRDEDGYMVICTEQCENPEDGGGSGKNIFWALFNLITTFKSTPAVLVNLNTNLLQSWDGQRIFVVSDMPKNFEITFFKDIVTGNATVNKKYINEFSVEIEDMCKIGGSSNFSFDNTDPGIRRRVRQIEFTNYYTLKGGVNKAHNGRMFPKDWDNIEYLHFDNIMIMAIQEYLKAGNKIDKKEMTDTGWNKQFAQKYNHLYDFFRINIDEWISIVRLRNEYLKDEYGKYCDENNISLKWRYSSTIMNKAIIDYCSHIGIGVDIDYAMKDDKNRTVRAKRFYKIESVDSEVIESEVIESEVEEFNLF